MPTGGIDMTEAYAEGRLVIDDSAPEHDEDYYVLPGPPELEPEPKSENGENTAAT